jgi:formylglycine-generating enzyme required for sulfatase activity
LIRGGGWDSGPSGGVFAVVASFNPVFYREVNFTGFRCAR